MGRCRQPHARAPRLLHPGRHRRPRPGRESGDADLQLTGPRYTFGDTELARRRLDLVADVFAPASTAFLQEQVNVRPSLALDLGCGPGRTTRMVAEVTDAGLVVGLDASEPFVRAARAAGLSVLRADVTRPFPTRPPDLAYARLLLAHLPEPERIVARWTEQLKPGGLLLLDEVEWIETPNPVLDLYERIVSAMVGARGAQISVGSRISDLAGDGWTQRSNVVRRYPVATADAAAMYAMNLATWRHDPFVVENYDRATIDELAAGLADLTRSATTGEIEWGLRQVAYQREAP